MQLVRSQVGSATYLVLMLLRKPILNKRHLRIIIGKITRSKAVAQPHGLGCIGGASGEGSEVATVRVTRLDEVDPVVRHRSLDLVVVDGPIRLRTGIWDVVEDVVQLGAVEGTVLLVRWRMRPVVGVHLLIRAAGVPLLRELPGRDTAEVAPEVVALVVGLVGGVGRVY